jgi:prophage regulatory protein
VKAKTGLGISSIYALMRAGTFPKNFAITKQCRVWDEAEVDAWVKSRSEAGRFVPMAKRVGA